MEVGKIEFKDNPDFIIVDRKAIKALADFVIKYLNLKKRSLKHIKKLRSKRCSMCTTHLKGKKLSPAGLGLD